MGRTANITKALEESSNQFKPQELNEENVHAIFNRCLAEIEDRKTTTLATLFPPELGYEDDPDAQVLFQTDALLQNKKNIEYLYGQLIEVHDETPVRRVSFWDFSVAYSGKPWTQEEQAVLQLLYLGVNYHLLLIEPFWAKMIPPASLRKNPSSPPSPPRTRPSRRGGRNTRRSGKRPKIKVNR